MCISNWLRVAQRSTLFVVLAALLMSVGGGCPNINQSAARDVPLVKPPPVLCFSQPSADVSLYQGESVEIAWYATDTEDSVRVELYYDKDGIYGSGDETLLTAAYTTTDRPDLSYAWTPGPILPGVYHIIAVADDGVNDPVTATLAGTITVKSSGPSLAVFEPANPITIGRGHQTTIGWRYDTPLKGGDVTLFYDNDRDISNGTLGTIMSMQVPAGTGSQTYAWEVPALPAGQYYVGATLKDQEHPPVTVYAAATIAIDAPALCVDSPASTTTVRCADRVPVTWRTDKTTGDVRITVFIDGDGLAGTGDERVVTELSQPAGTSHGAGNVGLPVLPAGSYHMGLKMQDGQNTPVVAYAPGLVVVGGPGLTFTQPNQQVNLHNGDVLPVQWTALAGNSNDVRLTIFYDDNKIYGDGTLGTVAKRSGAQDPAGDATSWTIPPLPAGTYYVGGILDDGVNTPAVAYAPGLVQVMGPTLTFSEPSGTVSTRGGSTVPLRWKAQSGSASATLTIFYDNNENFADGTLGTVLERNGVQNPAGDTANWVVPALPAGTYYIGGILDDGLNSPVVVYAATQVVVSGPALTLTAPAQDTTVARHGTMPIRWQAQAGGANVTVTVFYDDDQNFGNGTLGQVLQWKGAPKAGGDTGTWTVPALPAKAYYIGATLDDGINPPVTEYAAGRICVSNSTLEFSIPGAALTKTRGDMVYIQWDADTDGTAATITIFYDDDTNYANGTSGQIVQRTGVPGIGSDSVNWTLPALKGGMTYVGGKVDDGVNPPLIVYASGAIVAPFPQLTFVKPDKPLHLLAGSTVQIAWSHTTQADAARVELFYDGGDGPGGTIATIDVPGSATAMTYDWVTPPGLGGPIFIGARLTDGVNSPLTFYAMAGRIWFENQATLTRPLDQVEYVGFGRTFRGLSPGGRLGAVAAQVPWTRWHEDPKDPRPAGKRRLIRQPGIDFNGDKYDDFVLVAPSANPFYLERPHAGEAYLIHSHPAALFDLSMSLDPLVVSKTGSSNGGGDNLHGVVFAGPATNGSTEGIGAVTICPDVDGDQIPELLFGFPWVDEIHQEEQDYDPWDKMLDALGTASLSFRTYSDNYRDPHGANMDSVTAGFVVAVSGSSGQIGAPLTRPTTDNTVIGLDHVGMTQSDTHPLVVPNARGVRLYCPDPFRGTCPQADYFVQYPQRAVSDGIQDQGRFGESMAQVDVNGDGTPEWIFIQPANRADKADSRRGWVYVMWPQLSQLWGADLTKLSAGDNGSYIKVKETTTGVGVTAGQKLDASGKPVNDPVTNQPIPTVITTTTTTVVVREYRDRQITTTTDVHMVLKEVDQQSGLATPYPPTAPVDTHTVTTTPAPAGMYPLALDSLVYSWPYAVGVGNYSMELEIDGNSGAITASREVFDEREREFIYPMFFDCIRGFNVDADGHDKPEVFGYLKGLANAGDFNHDNREDITLGAPQANPGGLTNAGCAFLVFGRANFGDHSLSTIGLQDDNALAGIKITGSAANQQVGFSQANAGDFNGDGISDWVIGIPGYNNGAGAVAIIYGTTGRQGTYSVADIGTPVLPGILLTGVAAGDAAGFCVAGVGDVDGDGYDDVAIVAPGASATLPDGSHREHCGVVYLVYGGPRFTGACGTVKLADLGTAALPGKTYAGPPGAGSQLQTVAPAGDVDNDGLADFLIGNPAAGAQNVLDVGEVYLIRGSDRLAP